MISFRARMVRLLSKQFFKRVNKDSDIPPLRKFWGDLAGRARVASAVRIRETTIGGIACEWLVPEGSDKKKVLLYLHGGAYVMGSPATHRRMVSFISAYSGIPALLPDYRLAPEHPFPAGLEDCLSVYRHITDGQVSAENLAIGGDSAGGGMTMATLLSLRDAGDALPAAAVLLSPWLDLAATGESTKTRAEHDPWFDPADMPSVVDHYCDPNDRENPLVSPLYGDVSGLPPMLVQVGDHEILLSDSTRIAEKISAAGGEVDLQVWPGMWHVFQYFVGQMPESRKAIRKIAEFLKLKIG
jgi:monoterpene epsilon-lactone hydrolase